jgi:hypothetical protein
MATFESTIYAAQKSDRANTSRLPAPNQAGGGVQFAVVPIALDDSVLANDIIDLCILPAGAIPIPGMSSVDCEATSTADPVDLSVDVGYASNPDALADGIALGAGGSVLFTSGTMPADALVPAGLASTDTTIYATVASVDTPVDGAVIVFKIAYKMPA